MSTKKIQNTHFLKVITSIQQKTPLRDGALGMVSPTCNPGYSGSRGRKSKGQVQLGQSQENPVSKMK
jgi:hypothetical protein